ncbi:LacI family DNA-binding transcriptional regulator [Paenibacillus thermotolerans]|uniref:LacI family DNA-binding transcriptional regulator n=1 Tax=Paenibacillus thermotolerans TaxID=3027807 RepID=UPI0023675D09|nr:MULTISPECIES: LacI family DNA-binding transcriptional regulator [unclassified Paenibacillus]
MVTIYDIAKRANCSAMTVSRVINNSGRVGEETRQRVLSIMKELQYVPNQMARSLVLQKSNLLSLLITDIGNPFYTTLVRGAEDAARRLGYRLLLGNSDEDVKKEKDYIDTILSAKVDGVLFAPAGDSSAANLAKLKQHDIPFVLLDRDIPGIESDAVMGDSKAGARELVEYLISLGHRRIALLNGLPDVSTARLRKAGYEEALRLHGLESKKEYLIEVGYTAQGTNAQWETIVNRLFAAGEAPTAIFAANNFLALGAIRSLLQRGIRVPEDISVVCFDELEAGYVVDPYLTVAAQPAYDFGAIGMQMLVERIEGTASGEWRKVILPPKLCIRKSAAPVTV